jgi:urease accessory protein
MKPDYFLGLLQFADGLFPSGAYAHSLGLETYVAAGAISGMEGVEAIVRAHLAGSAGPADTVAMANAIAAQQAGALAPCLLIDRHLDAFKPAAEARAASRQMGRQTLRIAADLLDQPLLSEFCAAARRDLTPGHHAVAFGMVAGACEWPPLAAALAYLHATAVAMSGAALRLLPLGQLEGQRMLHRLAPLIARLAQEAIDRPLAEMMTFAPELEIAAMRHATLEARLFRS